MSRRQAAIGGAALAFVALLALLVGRHPGMPGTVTTLPAIGRTDGHVFDWVQTLHGGWVNPFLEPLSRLLNIVGGSVVTAPVRVAVVAILLWKRLWIKTVAFAATVVFSELFLSVAKNAIDRSRPPAPLVHTSGASFPSGHTVATASTAVALVLILIAPSAARRAWGWGAAILIVLMAFSRIYLNAHWLTDVVAGALLGFGVAVLCVAFVERIARRRAEGTAGGDP